MRLAHTFFAAAAIAFGGLATDARATGLFSEVGGATNFSIFPGWQRVMAHQAEEPARVQPIDGSHPCQSDPDCKLLHWYAFLEEAGALPRDAQIDAVNRWANAHEYVEDWANWGLPDYWATPKEFLSRGGDCEDYAIIKYFSLVRLGFSPDDLRIVVVNDTNLGIFHAVLAVRQENSEVVLLDNQVEQVVPIALARHYLPIYSLNERAWWMAPQAPVAIHIKNFPVESLIAAAGR